MRGVVVAPCLARGARRTRLLIPRPRVLRSFLPQPFTSYMCCSPVCGAERASTPIDGVYVVSTRPVTPTTVRPSRRSFTSSPPTTRARVGGGGESEDVRRRRRQRVMCIYYHKINRFCDDFGVAAGAVSVWLRRSGRYRFTAAIDRQALVYRIKSTPSARGDTKMLPSECSDHERVHHSSNRAAPPSVGFFQRPCRVSLVLASSPHRAPPTARRHVSRR